MGTSLSSVHIFSDSAPTDCDFHFQSFSSGWQTCIDDFSEEFPDYPYKVAKFLSKQTDAPVLHFSVYDSEMIWFDFFRNGKMVAKYSDDEFVSNKKLYDIPALIGYEDGQKKRLSSILSCSDIDLKIHMLEEYLGVCLPFSRELMEMPEYLQRERSDEIYQKYAEEEKALTGKAAPIMLRVTAEYPGKLFDHFFGNHNTVKPHYFLHGYTTEDFTPNYHSLVSVRFTGESLEVSDPAALAQGCEPQRDDDKFQIHYGTPCKVTFSQECPSAFRGKTMKLPNGFQPFGFTGSGELLLEGCHRLFVVNESLKVIAKLSIKGDVADLIDDYILTTTGDSFCGYCYEPKAKIYIYKMIRNSESN